MITKYDSENCRNDSRHLATCRKHLLSSYMFFSGKRTFEANHMRVRTGIYCLDLGEISLISTKLLLNQNVVDFLQNLRDYVTEIPPKSLRFGSDVLVEKSFR